MKDQMMMEDDYAESAGALQDETDAMLEVPKGRFSKSALNGLVASFNKALTAADMEGNYPTFTSDQTAFPVEFVRGLAMMSDAAAESGSNIEISLAGVESDREVATLAAKLAALAESEEFVKMMSGAEESEPMTEETDSTEALMMERA